MWLGPVSAAAVWLEPVSVVLLLFFRPKNRLIEAILLLSKQQALGVQVKGGEDNLKFLPLWMTLKLTVLNGRFQQTLGVPSRKLDAALCVGGIERKGN